MPFSTFLTGLALFSTTGWAGYVLDQDYMAGGNFFDQFTFWNSTDPTNGFVLYQTQDSANDMGLISSSASQIKMGVDHTGVASSGRPSVRITSKASYQSGLFIIDLDHMPGGICGTWPAFWLVGPDWPNQGEIDIIEGANDQQTNKFTLHTGPGCTIGGGNPAGSSKAAFSGTVDTSNCDVNAAGQDTNVGCGITTTNTATYGSGFNQNNGGVFATEWTDSGISIYFFDRNSIPSDISSGSPNPSSWGQPVAAFEGGCNFGEHFTNQQIVFDTTFCGDWAGATWSTGTCASKANTCEDYVANSPGAFADAFWQIKSLKVFQNKGASSPAPSSAPAPAPSSAAPSAPQPSGWGGQSSFHTQPSAAPVPSGSGIPEISGAPGWPAPSGAPSAAPSEAPSAASGQPSGHALSNWGGQPGWPASQTWGGNRPWQSGGWSEVENSDGSWSVGQPVQGSVVVEENVDKRESEVVDVKVQRIHSRHLAKHRRAARHAGRAM